MTLDQAVEYAVELIIRDGCSDITTESVETILLNTFKTEFRDDVRAKLMRSALHEMEFKPIQHILTPKNRYVFDYRKAAIITPSCLAKYTAIVLQYAKLIEQARIPISENRVFSYRIKPTEKSLFDPDINYSRWKEDTQTRATDENVKFIVSCDIASFYDRINIHRIESTLIDIGVPEKLIKLTNDLLLFWSKKDSYGLPVGNAASRILAESALIDIDQYLVSESINFTRYVDDYRLFSPDLVTAQKWMNKLTTRLFRDGLMLNTAKTGIRKVDNNTQEPAPITEEAPETVLKSITRLSGGYSRIIRRFIMPAEDKHVSFLSIDLERELNTLLKQPIIDFIGIQKLVIAALVQKKFHSLLEIAKICSKFLYGLDYFVDMLLKNVEFIPEPQREEIANFYESLVLGSGYYEFEWHCASLAKLLSSPSYFRKKALLHLFKDPGKDISTYASIIALEGLKEKLTRSEFRTIREYFDRCDEWERRRLIWISDALPDEERKAWAKAIKSTLQNDILSYHQINAVIRG